MSPSMLTPFGAAIDAFNAWPEYPRPALARAKWLNLNGAWDFALLPRAAPAPSAFPLRINVPFPVESLLSGVQKRVTEADRMWYRRRFALPDAWGPRTRLNLEASDYETTIWVNGALVGHHRGGFLPFSFEITAFLKDGTPDNEILVSVWDPSDAAEQPRGKQTLRPRGIWYTAVSGIWGTVWLEPVPERYIAELRVTPEPDLRTVRVEAMADAEEFADDGLAVRLTASAGGVVVATAVVRANRTGFLEIPSPRTWSPDDPFLYDLKAELVRVEAPQQLIDRTKRFPRYGASERALYASLSADGPALDTVTSYFGIRTVSIALPPGSLQPAIHLNSRPLFLHGPLDQGWWPDGLHTPPSDAALEWELARLKECGLNLVRKHIKVEPRRWYHHCSRIGLAVWQDVPSGFTPAQRTFPGDEGEILRLSGAATAHEGEALAMVRALGSEPCVVGWVVHNEGWGQYGTARLAAAVKALDPSRLCIPVTGWNDVGAGDVRSEHSYHEVTKQPVGDGKRAVVLGEYGGLGWPVEGHLWDPSMTNWGYQTYRSREDYLAALTKKIGSLLPMRTAGMSAAVYTQASDVEGEVNGLWTYDRRLVKVDVEALAELNRALIAGGPKAAL
ncbi:glycoside hydrolase family 2 sugar binding protein [Hyaloraphidium curvatum]|nr:glycoside hydrolase family 2 sugar binding protein [Hyaloraphidium curvatum]